MIPIGDSIQSRSTPYVNVSIIAACVLVFLYQLTLTSVTVPQLGIFSELDRFFRDWGAVPACLTDSAGLSPNASPRLIEALCPDDARLAMTPLTAMFLHGGWLHLGGNMIFLWVFGDNVEDAMGHARYAIFYLLTGLLATAAHIALNQSDLTPVIGASGAIAGVLGAYLMLFPRANVTAILPIFILFWIPFHVPAVFLIGFWFLLQIFSGVASITSTDVAGGTAWFAHIGGFVAGVLLVRLFALRRRRRRRLRVIPGGR
ncbi:MAG: rhomboid family intramembrane serine protease [Chloroflexi bacterium]|nr:rhomboid family intramembrane serine protease [Chloroflexota bacterium]